MNLLFVKEVPYWPRSLHLFCWFLINVCVCGLTLCQHFMWSVLEHIPGSHTASWRIRFISHFGFPCSQRLHQHCYGASLRAPTIWRSGFSIVLWDQVDEKEKAEQQQEPNTQLGFYELTLLKTLLFSTLQNVTYNFWVILFICISGFRVIFV